ncbi:MAG: hypothetical protein LCH51_00990 [Bacteroidetes bacterium]|nr:hypothetical protein [Bacteroidota bacterium]
MPENYTQTEILDHLAMLVQVVVLVLFIQRKAWTQKPLLFIMINVCYGIATSLLSYIFPVNSYQSDVISNLTIHVDTLSGFGFFYSLWNVGWYRKFLKRALTLVLLIWISTMFITRDFTTHSWTLISTSIWYILASNLALYLLYKKGNFQHTQHYASRFLLITSFLFYNFSYTVIEVFYLHFKDDPNITNDAWNINYWSYLIFRLVTLTGVAIWLAKPREQSRRQLATG